MYKEQNSTRTIIKLKAETKNYSYVVILFFTLPPRLSLPCVVLCCLLYVMLAQFFSLYAICIYIIYFLNGSEIAKLFYLVESIRWNLFWLLSSYCFCCYCCLYWCIWCRSRDTYGFSNYIFLILWIWVCVFVFAWLTQFWVP